MRAVDIIRRKRDGEELEPDAIEQFVHGATDGSWADYQLAAMLMAIRLRGMTAGETVCLTRSMADSGTRLSFRDVGEPLLDKHSTGGVGDKISLVLAPVVAACGGFVPMMSGWGLGHTGGTIDKIESIPGVRTDLDRDGIRAALSKAGCCIAAPTGQVAPADGRLYVLRDVTATVDSVPLITASILSKKLAEGLDALILDVKVGRGAFMKTEADARTLAESLMTVGGRLGLRVEACLTRMDAPLGSTVGNALEVREALETLDGRGPPDVRSLSITLAARLLCLGGLASGEPEAERRVRHAIDSGEALARFRDMIAAQGGDPRVVDDHGRLPQAPCIEPYRSSAAGVVAAIHADGVGMAAAGLGAGRARAGEAVDPAAGIRLLVEAGEAVVVGQPLAELHGRARASLAEAGRLLQAAFVIADEAPPPAPLVLASIGSTLLPAS